MSAEAPGAPLSASAAIVTFERPAFLERAIRHLQAQTRPPLEIVVVDSSLNDESRRLVAEKFPDVVYKKCDAGYGATATARNMAFELCRGDVIAFVDDDAFAEPDWLERLMPLYDDPTVGAVGGRASNNIPGEESVGVDAVGKLLADGTLTGNFAADTKKVIEVDHLLGANMSFRRSVIERIGGIRDGYAGTCLREETDLALRVKALGYKLLYTPFATVEHVAAPYARKGQRFDLRYAYWAQHNTFVLFIRNFGVTSPVVRRFLVSSLGATARSSGERLSIASRRARDHDATGALRATASGVLGTLVVLGATPVGIVRGLRLARRDKAPSAPRGDEAPSALR